MKNASIESPHKTTVSFTVWISTSRLIISALTYSIKFFVVSEIPVRQLTNPEKSQKVGSLSSSSQHSNVFKVIRVDDLSHIAYSHSRDERRRTGHALNIETIYWATKAVLVFLAGTAAGTSLAKAYGCREQIIAQVPWSLFASSCIVRFMNQAIIE